MVTREKREPGRLRGPGTAIFGLILATFGLPGCDARSTAHASPARAEESEVVPVSSLKLTSPAFSASGPMPAKHTCEGLGLSPPLSWSNAPDGTKTFALVLDDPDAPDPQAPRKTFVHWVLADIPATENTLREGASPSGLPPGTRVGRNDFGNLAYGAPCPPVGRHRYFHKLYALDTVLELTSFTKADLEKAMKGHVLGEADLIGTYQKGQSSSPPRH